MAPKSVCVAICFKTSVSLKCDTMFDRPTSDL